MARYDVVGFEELMMVRIRKADLKLAAKIVKHDKVRYSSLSHYIRCCILRLNREEKKRLRL
jgi:hypothetical protein